MGCMFDALRLELPASSSQSPAPSLQSAHAHRISGPGRAAQQHPGVDAAPSRVDLLRDPREVLVLERMPDLLARRRVTRDGQTNLADVNLAFGDEQTPVDARDREVLARRSRCDGMPFALQIGNE